MKSIRDGVPQGSVLDPILFLLFINDIVRCSNKLEFILYADDTTLVLRDEDLSNIQNTVNEELLKISQWIRII